MYTVAGGTYKSLGHFKLGNNMTTEELLNLDFREQRNRDKLLKALKIIPPLSKIPDDELEPCHLEKALHIMCNKYGIFVRIQQDPVSGDKCDIWHCIIYNRKDLSTLGSIYGISLFEVFIKTNIAAYSIVKKIKRREKRK